VPPMKIFHSSIGSSATTAGEVLLFRFSWP
jgi:hypothetical protein